MARQVTVIDGSRLEWSTVSEHRQGPISFKRFPIDSGVEGLNLAFSLTRLGDGFYSPRHRHNFDQVRFVLEGRANMGTWELQAGECAYFPEGVYYGPQQQKGECILLTLQFPGSSGAYFMSYDELAETYRKLQEAGGRFDRGVYSNSGNGRQARAKDGYEALWEAHQGQKLVYPAPRYRDVVVMKAAAFSWVPDRLRPGAEVKHLGTFTEYRTGVSLLRLAPGTDVNEKELMAPEIRYLLAGKVCYGEQEYAAGCCFFLPAHTRLERLSSKEGAQLFVVSLPLIIERSGQQEPRSAVLGRS